MKWIIYQQSNQKGHAAIEKLGLEVIIDSFQTHIIEGHPRQEKETLMDI